MDIGTQASWSAVGALIAVAAVGWIIKMFRRRIDSVDQRMDSLGESTAQIKTDCARLLAVRDGDEKRVASNEKRLDRIEWKLDKVIAHRGETK